MAEGGVGDDFVSLSYGATGYGGDVADTISVSPRGFSTENENAFVRITDFDITEDVLMIDNGQLESIERIEITHADDGSYSDVTVVYDPVYSNQQVPVVIRLDGDTGITLDHIVVNA